MSPSSRSRWRPGELRAGCLSALSWVLGVLAVFVGAAAFLERQWLTAGVNVVLSTIFGWGFTYWHPRTRGARLVREWRECSDVRK